MGQIGISEVGSGKVDSEEVGIQERSPAEVDSAEVGPEEVGIGRIGATKVGPLEVSTEEVGPEEVWRNVRVLIPPLIPCLYALLQDLAMLWIHHRLCLPS